MRNCGSTLRQSIDPLADEGHGITGSDAIMLLNVHKCLRTSAENVSSASTPTAYESLCTLLYFLPAGSDRRAPRRRRFRRNGFQQRSPLCVPVAVRDCIPYGAGRVPTARESSPIQLHSAFQRAGYNIVGAEKSNGARRDVAATRENSWANGSGRCIVPAIGASCLLFFLPFAKRQKGFAPFDYLYTRT